VSEDPVQFGSLARYQFILFVVILFWAFLGFAFAQTSLVVVVSNPYSWLVSSVGVVVSLFPPILLISWRAKQEVKLNNPKWETKTQEVDLPEFKQMMGELSKQYTYLIARCDLILLLITIMIVAFAVGAPFLLLTAGLLILTSYPFLFGVMILVYGIVLASFLQRALPNSATSQFPFHSPRRFKKAIRMMDRIPGVAWTGVSVEIGESMGYYTLRNPVAVARVEGIEGAARIEAVTDRFGRFVEAVSTISLEPTQDSVVIRVNPLTGNVTPCDLTNLVRRTLEAYVAAKGSNEILEEILEELGVAIHAEPIHDGEDSSVGGLSDTAEEEPGPEDAID
jgi:hypothetical protein